MKAPVQVHKSADHIFWALAGWEKYDFCRVLLSLETTKAVNLMAALDDCLAENLQWKNELQVIRCKDC